MKHLLITTLLLSVFSCQRETSEYILPHDFEGIVVIFYNIKNGNEDRMINSKITYMIPKNGVYYTKNKILEGSLVEYYYLDSKGKKEYIKLSEDQNKNEVVSLGGEYQAREKGNYPGYKAEAVISYIGKDTSRIAIERMRGEGRRIFDSISEIILNKRLLND